MRNIFKLQQSGDLKSSHILSKRIVYEGRTGARKDRGRKSIFIEGNSEIVKFVNKYKYQSAEHFLNQMKGYFENNFIYTLSPGAYDPKTFATEMLFKRKQGFCLHFATLLTELLLTKGIPAHLVLGYAGGSFNSFGEYFLVKQSNAHAWVEVWFNHRWNRVDPTIWVAPEVLLDREANSKGIDHIWNRIRYYFDQKSTALNMLLINYDFQTQKNWLKRKLNISLKWYQLFGLFLLTLALLALVYVFFQYMFERNKMGYYERLEKKIIKKLEQRGYEKCLNCSLYTYLKLSENRGDDLVSKYLIKYLSIRYGKSDRRDLHIPF
jgi:hypothetical protein